MGGYQETNLKEFGGRQTAWSESCGLASEPLCPGFLGTLLMGVHHFFWFVWEGVVVGLAGR